MSDLPGKLSFARLKDGVVAFDLAEDAARYATWLEAELAGQQVPAGCSGRVVLLLTAGRERALALGVRIVHGVRCIRTALHRLRCSHKQAFDSAPLPLTPDGGAV